MSSPAKLRDLMPIVLGAKRETWRMGEADHDRDDEFRAIRPKILQRDNYTCRFCGFRSLSYQEVHHLNDDHRDNRPDNLFTACPFCHMCFHIGYAGLMREGFLIWVDGTNPPPQHAINNIARALYMADKRGDPPFPVAISMLLEQINARRQLCEQKFGSSNPLVLGDALIAMTDEEYGRRELSLRHIRFFPHPRRFNLAHDIWPAMSDFYISEKGPFGSLPPTTWDPIAAILEA